MNPEYSQIASYEGKEIPEVIERILNSDDFRSWLRRTTGRRLPKWVCKSIVWILRHTHSPLLVIDWFFAFPFLFTIKYKSTKGLKLKGLKNRPKGAAFYMTNHRDIILDAAFLTFMLRIKTGVHPYLGVGNNLFGKPWIEELMRVFRCFAVIRNGGPREVMHNAQILSGYIADRQAEGRSFWMAQREGRAKDSNDTTQPAVLKMLTLAHEDSLVEAVKALHITPVAITYEYDPCDYLKAREMQLKRDDPAYRKTQADDMRNMQTGLKGQKGKVTLNITPCINDELDAMATEWSHMETPPTKNEQLALIGLLIDKHIHAGYKLCWTNYAAKAILEGKEDKNIQKMEKYIQSRINLIKIDNRDDAFLRQQILTMYANPAINQEKALQ